MFKKLHEYATVYSVKATTGYNLVDRESVTGKTLLC